jgi:hypothetical protein
MINLKFILAWRVRCLIAWKFFFKKFYFVFCIFKRAEREFKALEGGLGFHKISKVLELRFF